ncbi:MAG: polysaccharide deacetylase family protein [Chryseotalea sp.]
MTLPFRTPFFLPHLYPDLIWRMEATEKNLYLTFDDGPIPDITEWVIAQLNQFNVQATFFAIGVNVRKYPDVFRELVRNNHSVGNHTFHHVKGWQTQTDDYIKEISMCDEIMQQTIPLFHSELFRPPYGRITRTQRKKIAQKKIIMWDVLTQDYNQSLDKEKCLQGSIKAMRPGSIVVLHDSLKAERNLKYVLPRLLEFALNHGYTFKKL